MTQSDAAKPVSPELDDKGRPAPPLLGAHLALDFLNSVGAVGGSDYDWIADGPDLLAWLAEAGAIGHNEAELLTAYAARHGLANACRVLLNTNDFLFIH